MGCVRFFRPRLVLGLALLATLAGVAPTGAKAQAKTEIVPSIPHFDTVASVALSPDGTRALSGGHDKTVKLWDAATGVLLRTFEGHSSYVESVAFSPDGARVLSGSWDSTLKVWDVATGKLLRTLRGHSTAVSSVAFSPDGARVLSGSHDKTLRLWDAATGALLRTFEGHSKAVKSVAFSPDGARVWSGSDFRVMLWDTATGAPLRTLGGLFDPIRFIAISRDGARILLGHNHTQTLRLWDAAAGVPLRTFEANFGTPGSAAFSSDGTRVLASSPDNTVRLWDAATGKLLRTFRGHSSYVESVAFSPDGARVLSGSVDRTVQLWDAASGAPLRTLGGDSNLVRSVAFSPDGLRVLSGGSDKTLKLWDAATGAPIRTFEGHSDQVSSVAFSPDGLRVLSGGRDKVVRLWDAAAGAPIRTFEGHSQLAVFSVAFSPDGARVLSGSWDGTVRLWDAAAGKLLRAFKGHSGPVSSVTFSPDGTRVLSGSLDRTVRLWDAATGKLLRTSAGYAFGVASVAFSPDGDRLLSDNGKTIRLWDAATGAQLRILWGHSDLVSSVAFSPDGARVLSGSWDKTIRLWDAATGALLRTFEGHSDEVWSVKFSPDGRRIVSGSKDATNRVWDATTGALLVTFIGGRDGRWLARTPAGFFAGSRSANDLLGIVRGLEVTTIDQVHQSLYSPDLVREALAGDPEGEVREAAKVIDLEKVLDSGPPPRVAIASPADGSQSGKDVVTVTARIEDRGRGVGRIEWRVNGITAAVAAKPEGSGRIYTVTKQLALDPGDNAIEVLAFNGSNLLASRPMHTTVKFTGPADKTKPTLHILTIGIDAYEDQGWTPPGADGPLSFGPLDLAVKDAKTFAVSMQKAGAGLYEEVRVTLALDRDATRERLHKLVDKVAVQVHPRDSFILFAAGHGYSRDGRFYLIAQDHQGGINPKALSTHAIGQDDLQDWLANRIRARKALILLDTCESGALIAGHTRSRVDSAASEAGVGRLHEATGRPVLTAAAAGQFAHEGLIGATGERHGVFTWAVLDALHKGDSDGNGLIELSELVAHVQSVVPEVAAQLRRAGRAATAEPVFGQQAARFGSRGEDFAVVRRLH